ncbi:uncharacterized protein [Mobula birostris]|uniref:uncharacterized protein n=1 Tax=Mobula birostris TaxID=1983395 RepID=UPI003B27E323
MDGHQKRARTGDRRVHWPGRLSRWASFTLASISQVRVATTQEAGRIVSGLEVLSLESCWRDSASGFPFLDPGRQVRNKVIPRKPVQNKRRTSKHPEKRTSHANTKSKQTAFRAEVQSQSLQLIQKSTSCSVHNPDLMETDMKSTEEYLEKLLKCLLCCRCYCAIENLRRGRPQILGFAYCLLPGPGLKHSAEVVLGAQCRAAGRRLEVFGRTQESAVVGCFQGAASASLRRWKLMAGREFLFLLPSV